MNGYGPISCQSLAASPVRDTTLPGRQVGEGVSPALDALWTLVEKRRGGNISASCDMKNHASAVP